ncbi:MAG TPA: hypothetical protein VJX23_14160 [Candidatus Binataceae bacterium]|nr:hypothetical protein [Candidatus Binataceae bacterium]
MRALGGLLAIVASSMVFAACAALSTGTPAPGEILPPADASARVRELTQKIAERDRLLQSLQTEAIMAYSARDNHPPKVREQITVQRPDSLRVEAMWALSVPFIIASSGKRLTIFEPSKNKLIHVAATADALNQFIQIPMAPADVVTLLLGIAPDSSTLAARKPDSIGSEGEMTVASWGIEKSMRRELGFQDDQLAMVRLRDVTGAVEYEVRYSDYHDIGAGMMFPYGVDATFPIAQSRISFRYKRPIINGAVPASAFELSAPAAEQANLGNANQ